VAARKIKKKKNQVVRLVDIIDLIWLSWVTCCCWVILFAGNAVMMGELS